MAVFQDEEHTCKSFPYIEGFYGWFDAWEVQWFNYDALSEGTSKF